MVRHTPDERSVPERPTVDLLEWVGRSDDEARLRDAFRQLAEGVAALHANGTIHRALEPTHVRVTPEGRVLVLEFGLVADSADPSCPGDARYRAPEQDTPLPLTPAADWYSVGALLDEALAARPGRVAHVERALEARQGAAGLWHDLLDLRDALLAEDPAQRPTGHAVCAWLGAGPPRAVPTPGEDPFTGYGVQLAALDAAYVDARDHVVVRIVDGPSRGDRSALVHRFLRERTAREAALITLTGRCFEGRGYDGRGHDGANGGFTGVDGLGDALARLLRDQPADVQDALLPRDAGALVRLFPALARVERLVARGGADVPDPAEQRRRAFTALRTLLARVAARWPLVWFVDDVQWSAPDMAALVAEVLRPPDAPALLLLLTCRRADLSCSPLLARLLEIAREEQDPLDIAFVHVDTLSGGEAGPEAAGSETPGSEHGTEGAPHPRAVSEGGDSSPAGDAAEAAAWCLRAGEAAVAGLAFDRGVRHYRDALAHGAQGCEVHLRLAGALAAAGRGAEAARVQLTAAKLARQEDGPSLRAAAALDLIVQGHVDEGRIVLADALARVGSPLPRSPWRALASLLWRRVWLRVRGRRFRRRALAEIAPVRLARIDTVWSAAAGLAGVDPLRAAAFHAEGLLLALRAGDPLRVARSVSMELLHSAGGGSRNRARTAALARESEALVRDTEDPRAAARSLLHRGAAAFLGGQFGEARTLLDRADDALRTRCTGTLWERDQLDRVYVPLLAWVGDLSTLRHLAHGLPTDTDGRAAAPAALDTRLRTLHLLRLCDDAPEGLTAELDALLAAVPGTTFRLPHVAHLVAAAEVDLYQGRPADAWSRVASTWPRVAGTLLPRVQVTRVEGAWLRGRCGLALACSLPPGDPRRAALLDGADREIRSLLQESVPWAKALAGLLEASRARVDGRPDAQKRLTRAAERLDAAHMRLHAMAARLVAAAWGEHTDILPRTWMEEQGVRDPDRLARLYVPGG